MIVKTNVKLNLGLSVLRKRADGFHDIETLFVPCFDFGDTLEVITGDDYSRTSAALFAKYGDQDGRFDKLSDRGSQLSDRGQGGFRASGRFGKLGDLQEAPGAATGSATDYRGLAKEDGGGETVQQGNATLSEDGRLAQGISEDGKMMVTIAREEGVDWNPLNDLCAKAYSILAQDFDLPPVKIFLEKTAPVGAGLGGGSADAAFTLKALNELCGLGLDDQKLSEYAARLGSDCAFFVFNRPMIGSGRGEVLEPYGIDLSAYEIKVLIPEGVAVSTAEAYKGIVPRDTLSVETLRQTQRPPESTEPPEDSSDISERRMCDSSLQALKSSNLKDVLAMPVTEWKGRLVNDFEATVFKAHPELAAIKQSLYDSGAIYASMSGSGSALFALYRK